MPTAELACRDRLQKLGVKFASRSAEHDEKGCSMPYPLTVQSLGPEVKLEPEAVMNCAMAESMTDFANDVINPAAQREFGAKLASISHASAYVCRPRNGSAKLSEHAFGNALDIARFNLSNGTSVDVTPTPGEREARFLGSVRKAACGPFKTVLGPGSDADHGTHFHLDLAPRKNGGTFCE
ncbi:extensin family protein [Pseudaminobacter soli (ex Zhang et al. 2022)]|nr:extensin family protein [Pseudaminobacter soli]